MPDWLLAVVGLLAGCGIVVGIIRLSLRAESRRRKKRRLANPSGEGDIPNKYGESPQGDGGLPLGD